MSVDGGMETAARNWANIQVWGRLGERFLVSWVFGG